MNIMSSNYSSWLNQVVMLAAAEALRSNNREMIYELGLQSLDRIATEELKQLTADRINCVHAFKGSLAKVSVDTNQLGIFLNFSKTKTDEEDLIDKAILAGLRQCMLEELKGITRREFTVRREQLGIPEHKPGRIEVLSEADEIKVLRVWNGLDSIRDPLVRLLSLYEKTGISLDRAYTTIKQLA